MAHFAMRGRVVVDEAADYQTWLASQPTFAQLQARAAGDAVAGQAAYRGLRGLPRRAGRGQPLLNAPKLAGQPGWYLARQLHNFKHGVRGGATGNDIASQMAAIAATCSTTPPSTTSSPTSRRCRTRAAQPTVPGDAARGPSAIRDLRRLPRRRGPGHLVDQCAAAGAHERLVPGAAAAEFPAGASRRAIRRISTARRWRVMAQGRWPTNKQINDLLAYINTPALNAGDAMPSIGDDLMAYVAIADQHAHLHDPQTFLTKYIWSQDHKVIAIQYTVTAIAIGLVALGAVGADAAAARLSRQRSASSRRATTTSSSPCTG